MRRNWLWLSVATGLLIAPGVANPVMPILVQPTTVVQSGLLQQNGSSPVHGAWWFPSEQFGFLQIVFYSNGTYKSNVIGSGSFSLLPAAIRVSAADGVFDLPYGLFNQGQNLQLATPFGTVTFLRLSHYALSLLRGQYCGVLERDKSSAYQSVIEFDGRGAYVHKQSQGFYWVDAGGVHLVVAAPDFWAQLQFERTQVGSDGRIVLFSGSDGTMAECR